MKPMQNPISACDSQSEVYPSCLSIGVAKMMDDPTDTPPRVNASPIVFGLMNVRIAEPPKKPPIMDAIFAVM